MVAAGRGGPQGKAEGFTAETSALSPGFHGKGANRVAPALALPGWVFPAAWSVISDLSGPQSWGPGWALGPPAPPESAGGSPRDWLSSASVGAEGSALGTKVLPGALPCLPLLSEVSPFQ